MAWKLAWSIDAADFMGRVERPVAERIAAKLESVLENPSRHFSRLSGAEEWKLRVGDHRVIALLLHSERVVFVERVGHRKNIYKNK